MMLKSYFFNSQLYCILNQLGQISFFMLLSQLLKLMFMLFQIFLSYMLVCVLDLVIILLIELAQLNVVFINFCLLYQNGTKLILTVIRQIFSYLEIFLFKNLVLIGPDDLNTLGCCYLQIFFIFFIISPNLLNLFIPY